MADQNNAPELLPCPFCGKTPRFYPAQVLVENECPESVCCDNEDCGLQPATDYLPPLKAIAEWNTRADRAAPEGQPVTLTYTNWRGETAERTITPKRIWFGSTDWHPEPQWLLTAFDAEKQADRDFALKDFGQVPPPAAPHRQRETAMTEALDRYGNRKVPKMYAQINELRRAIRAEGTPTSA